MSVSIFKPISTYHNYVSNLARSDPKLQKVKKQLFGPTDPEEYIAGQKFIEDELKKSLRIQGARWNFDFENETTLEPDGVYIWRPSTPVTKPARPVKRRPSDDIEFDIEDLYCFPEEISRTDKSTNVSSDDLKKNPKSQQTLITDFMQIKKNATQVSMKKLNGRPAKISRGANSELQSTS